MMILLQALFFYGMTFAGTRDQCLFELQCKLADKSFSLSFKSPSNDCSEDDMKVYLKSDSETTELGIKPNWFFYTDHISKTQPSICEGSKKSNAFAAYEIDSDRALLFLKSSGRPGLDVVLAVLIEVQRKKVLDSIELGRTRNQFVAVLKTKTGFKTRIVRDTLSFHKDVSCDCDAPFVDDWMAVTVSKEKIKTSWIVK
jgi:hypothetical protein